MAREYAEVVPISDEVGIDSYDDTQAAIVQGKVEEVLALAAASMSWNRQAQLIDELASIQITRYVGEAVACEVAALAATVQRCGAQVATMSAVYAHGLAATGADPEMIEQVRDMGFVALSQMQQTQIETGANLIERTRTFRAPASRGRPRDVAYHAARGTLPGQMLRRRGGWR